MKQLSWMVLGLSLALTLPLAACENTRSKLDDLPGPGAAMPKALSIGSMAEASADHSGTVEERLTRIENTLAKYNASLELLGTVYDQQQQQEQEQARSEPAPDAVFALAVANDVKAGMVEGPATAPVTIVKAFDFACPYCMKANDTMKELVAEYGGKVRVVYKNLVVHPDTAMAGHLASCAAAKQQQYTAFKNAFWTKAFTPYAESRGQDPGKLGKATILAIAKDIGLDPTKLAADMDSEACKTLIREDMADLEKFQVTATPTFFINGRLVAGLLPKEAFKTIIDEKLKIAEASGISGAAYYEQEIMGKGEPKFRSKQDPGPQ
ncbi:MAG: thioredoxin domain-containing protein [Deltaproteobacteria bacterium]|nr:thioredoxin domain-containing protein [Deltaproteobacteria bacterium]